MKTCKRCPLPLEEEDAVTGQRMHHPCWAAHMREYRAANRTKERERERDRSRQRRALEKQEKLIGESE